jgi:lysyl-tRNA synthetase class 2
MRVTATLSLRSAPVADDPVAGDHGGDDDNRLIAERRAKLAAWRERAIAFPNDFRRDALAAQLLTTYTDRDSGWLEANTVQVRVGGRMMFKRVMGRASFAKIADRSGQIQLFLQESANGWCC